MSNPAVSTELITFLNSSPVLAAHGYEAEFAGIRNVKVSRGGHFLGMWKRDIGVYEWIPAGYSQPQYRAHSAADAARFTTHALCGSAA